MISRSASPSFSLEMETVETPVKHKKVKKPKNAENSAEQTSNQKVSQFTFIDDE
jgi:hypothetical protein